MAVHLQYVLMKTLCTVLLDNCPSNSICVSINGRIYPSTSFGILKPCNETADHGASARTGCSCNGTPEFTADKKWNQSPPVCIASSRGICFFGSIYVFNIKQLGIGTFQGGGGNCCCFSSSCCIHF